MGPTVWITYLAGRSKPLQNQPLQTKDMCRAQSYFMTCASDFALNTYPNAEASIPKSLIEGGVRPRESYSVILASPVGHRTDGFWTMGRALHASSSLRPAALWIAADAHAVSSVHCSDLRA